MPRTTTSTNGVMLLCERANQPGCLAVQSMALGQARREGGVGGKLPRAPRRLGAPPSLKNIKYTRVHHFEKKFKNFLPLQRGPTGMFFFGQGAPECFPTPRCGCRLACCRLIE